MSKESDERAKITITFAGNNNELLSKIVSIEIERSHWEGRLAMMTVYQTFVGNAYFDGAINNLKKLAKEYKELVGEEFYCSYLQKY